MRHVIIFIACFVVGAAVALIVRTAFHKPYAESIPVATGIAVATPVATPAATQALPDPAESVAVVNTICPICGMAVDPNIAVQVWQGHRIGLGCAKCPAKFTAHADHYGAYALKNEKAPQP